MFANILGSHLSSNQEVVIGLHSMRRLISNNRTWLIDVRGLASEGLAFEGGSDSAVSVSGP